MQTMPRFTLKFMRFVVERLMTHITKWEDRYGDERDYRMKHLNTGLWQASDSIRQILDGEFNPMQSRDEVGTVGRPWKVEQALGKEYVTELLNDAPVPLRPVN